MMVPRPYPGFGNQSVSCLGLKDGDFTRDEAISLLEEHIDKVVKTVARQRSGNGMLVNEVDPGRPYGTAGREPPP